MKRSIIRTAAIALAAVLFLPGQVSAVSAQKACVMDAETGRVLYQRRADEQSLIASTTKIMTALVVCQQCNVLDRVRIPAEAVGIEGSSMYLQEGEILTVQELLYGLMLHSGNDAAVALAIYAGGTVEGFVEMMNDKARALGLDNTHFENPDGLDAPSHRSTARDLAVLAAYAMEDPVFKKTVSTKQIRIGERYLTNHNKLLWRVEGADGVKTGYTKAAGRILVSSAMRQGRRLVCVTINDPDDWNDHAKLLEQGFADYSVRSIVSRGQILGYRQVLGGDQEQVAIVAQEDFCYSLAEHEQLQVQLDTRAFDYAPVAQGEDAGYAYVTLDGHIVGRIPVVYADTVETESQRKKQTIRHRWFTGG